ncbi:MAG: DUF1015 domain-containing protein [Oscillospiraceae bacterium]|nr:DUF1015 domain-containing protein [Oscillospiraceae bacterium]
MPKIQPFNALMYHSGAGAWNSLCCPPYDVVSETVQRELESRNPYNAIRLERPLDNEPYKAAASRLNDWLNSGILRRDENPAYYMIEMDFRVNENDYTLRGFTARLELTPFSENRVLPHEETLSKAKADRLALMTETGCNFSAIYGLYNDDGTAEKALSSAAKAAPDIEFSMPDGVTHRLWRITDTDTQSKLTAALSDKQVFIADGHHRYETALKYRELYGAEYIMTTLVDMNSSGLVVLPTHRVIAGCETDAPERLLTAMREICDVAEVELREPPNGSVLMYWNGKSYKFTLKNTNAMKEIMPDKSDAYRELDVAILHSLMLEPHFGIDKAAMSAQSNLTYTRDMNEAKDMVDSGSGQCAFILAPTKISQIRDVSLAGEKMPQKSTYFYPKLITGLGFNQL